MKVIGIAASPRRNGNSEILLDKVLEGASSKGAETEKIAIDGLNIAFCKGGSSCRRSAKCSNGDDMAMLFKKFDEADAIVVASPVYFGSVTAQLKAMIDRCQPLWVERFILKKDKISTARKKGIFISTSANNKQKFFRNSREIIDIFFLVIGARLFKAIYGPGLEKSGDILKDKTLLKKAFASGASLLTR